MSKHRFAELQQLSAIRTTHDSLGWGLYIVSSEPRDEPSCMSNNPFHQCTVSGRSVLCSFLKRCQHRAHLSLQLFSDSFRQHRCSDEIVLENFDDCPLLTFGFHTFCPFAGLWLQSHCKTTSESPKQFNIFTPHVTANVSVAPFVSTTVDVPCPNDFTYMLNTFSPPEAATSFKTEQSH